jgi:hypothetical protein
VTQQHGQSLSPVAGKYHQTPSIGPPHWSHCLVIAVVSLVSACQTIAPPPQKVSIPIGISCLPSTMPARPAIATEAELALLDDYKWTLAIYLDRRSLLDYSAELEAILGACK